GFGRLEGIFPRAYVSNSSETGRVRYFIGGEYDYERIPVPDVTTGAGPDVIEDSGVVFARVDAQVGARHSVTLEALTFPSRVRSFGLGPRTDESATADITGRDLFAGVTHRFVPNPKNVLTLQFGAFGRKAGLSPNGSGLAVLS